MTVSNKVEIEIIYTFECYEQLFERLSVDETITKEEFLTLIFKELTKYCLLDQLVKLSCCQLEGNKLIDLLVDNNGKFFFNIDVNKDNDTMKNYKYKQEYIKSNHL